MLQPTVLRRIEGSLLSKTYSSGRESSCTECRMRRPGRSNRYLSGNPAVEDLDPPQQQRRILTAEGDAIGHCVLNVHAAGDIRDVVQVALRVGLLNVDGRMHHAIPHGQQRSRYACRTARSLGMPDQALQRRSRELIGVAVEGEFQDRKSTRLNSSHA